MRNRDAGGYMPSVTGLWDGAYQSSVDHTDAGELSLQVDSQGDAAFRGAMIRNGAGSPLVGTTGDPLNGGLSYPFETIGLGPDGWFQVAGAVALPVDPTVPAEALAEYQFFLTDGGGDDGALDVFRWSPGMPGEVHASNVDFGCASLTPARF